MLPLQALGRQSLYVVQPVIYAVETSQQIVFETPSLDFSHADELGDGIVDDGAEHIGVHPAKLVHPLLAQEVPGRARDQGEVDLAWKVVLLLERSQRFQGGQDPLAVHPPFATAPRGRFGQHHEAHLAATSSLAESSS